MRGVVYYRNKYCKLSVDQCFLVRTVDNNQRKYTTYINTRICVDLGLSFPLHERWNRLLNIINKVTSFTNIYIYVYIYAQTISCQGCPSCEPIGRHSLAAPCGLSKVFDLRRISLRGESQCATSTSCYVQSGGCFRLSQYVGVDNYHTCDGLSHQVVNIHCIERCSHHVTNHIHRNTYMYDERKNDYFILLFIFRIMSHFYTCHKHSRQ